MCVISGGLASRSVDLASARKGIVADRFPILPKRIGFGASRPERQIIGSLFLLMEKDNGNLLSQPTMFGKPTPLMFMSGGER